MTKVGVDISDEAGKYPLKLEPLQRPITIRDLLRHTSGITYGFFGEAAGDETLWQSAAIRRRFRQRRIRRPDRRTAACRSARHALELQPFHRRARPRRRGGLGADAVSIREAKTVRSARHVRDRVLSSRIRRSGRASREAFPVDRFRDQPEFGDPTLPRRWESGGAGLVSTIGDYARFAADAAERRRRWTAGATSSPRRSR